jgi:hypothetical protein
MAMIGLILKRVIRNRQTVIRKRTKRDAQSDTHPYLFSESGEEHEGKGVGRDFGFPRSDGCEKSAQEKGRKGIRGSQGGKGKATAGVKLAVHNTL